MNQAQTQRAPHSARHSARRRVAAALVAATVAAALTGTVAATTPAVAAGAQACAIPGFRDVAQGSSFYEAISWLRCEQIATGYTDGTYAPGRQITRGEVAQLLYRFSGETHRPGQERDFDDVAPGSAAFTAVSWMQQRGYARGYASGTFGVDRPISRGELTAFLYGMSGEEASTTGTSSFTDMGVADTFYAPVTWLHDTGLVGGYTDQTFRPGRAVTRGETAQFLYALETRVNGAPSAYRVPASMATAAVNATGGSGGAYRDAKSLSYTNGASTSQCHLYAEHLNGKAPHGIIVFLHGDGADEFLDPDGTMVAAYAELARKHNLMLVVPRTPDAASTTWWKKDSSGQYAADLFKDLGTKYNLDLNQVYWTGYSGGADTIAEQMMNSHSAGWTGGSAVIVAGGPAYGQRQPARPIPAALKQNFQMHWVVGSQDTPAAGGTGNDGYDALRSAKNGHAFYTGQGLKTSLTVMPGLNHFTIAPHGPATLARILANR